MFQHKDISFWITKAGLGSKKVKKGFVILVVDGVGFACEVVEGSMVRFAGEESVEEGL